MSIGNSSLFVCFFLKLWWLILFYSRQENVYDVLWIPRPLSDYPDRPRSPNRGDDTTKTESETKSEAKKVAAAPYRPPGSTGSLAEMMRREKEGAAKGKVVNNSTSTSTTTTTTTTTTSEVAKPRRIPGLPPQLETNKKQGNKNPQSIPQ